MMSSAALSTNKSSIVWRQSLVSSKQSSNESGSVSTGLRASDNPRAVDSVWKEDTEWVEDVDERLERCDRGVRLAGVREWACMGLSLSDKKESLKRFLRGS